MQNTQAEGHGVLAPCDAPAVAGAKDRDADGACTAGVVAGVAGNADGDEGSDDDEFAHTRVYRAHPHAVYSTIMAVLCNNGYFSVESCDARRLTIRCTAKRSGGHYGVSVSDRGHQGTAVTILPLVSAGGAVPGAQSDVEALFAGFLAVLRMGGVIEVPKPSHAAKLDAAGAAAESRMVPTEMHRDRTAGEGDASALQRRSAARRVASGHHPGSREATRPMQGGAGGRGGRLVESHPVAPSSQGFRPAAKRPDGSVTTGSTAIMPQGIPVPPPPPVPSAPPDGFMLAPVSSVEQATGAVGVPGGRRRTGTGAHDGIANAATIRSDGGDGPSGVLKTLQNGIASCAHALEAGARSRKDGLVRGFRLALRWMCLSWNVRRGSRSHIDGMSATAREDHDDAVSPR